MVNAQEHFIFCKMLAGGPETTQLESSTTENTAFEMQFNHPLFRASFDARSMNGAEPSQYSFYVLAKSSFLAESHKGPTRTFCLGVEKSLQGEVLYYSCCTCSSF